MPNGKLGDAPYTDIVVHDANVYSTLAADLVREISKFTDDKTRRALANLLLEKYNPYDRPNVAELERYLVALCDQLKKDASDRGFETD